MLVLERLDDPRRELVRGISGGGIADHPFVVAQLIVDMEGVHPIETAHAGHHVLLGSPAAYAVAGGFARIAVSC